MAAGPDSPSEMQTGVDPDRPEDRRNRAIIALIVLVTLAVLLAWWLWSNTAIVPDVTGLSEPDARAAIEAAGFKVGEVKVSKAAIEAPGRIDDQGIPGGVRALAGETIDLFLAGGDGFPEPDVVIGEVDTGTSDEDDGDSIRDRGDDEFNTDIGVIDFPGVPRVLNKPGSTAANELRAAGYRVSVIRAPNAGGIAKGRVFYQTPEPGFPRTSGVVEIWVSTGAPTPGVFYKRPNIP